MDRFLSCDWGTSNFRLRLVETATLNILAEEKSDRGIASMHRHWQKKTAGKNPNEKMEFYLDLVREHIGNIEKTEPGLKGIPLVFSGMASSSIGMKELPYGALPFRTDGKGIQAAAFPNLKGWDHPVLLISGIRTETDVIRGEETQLVGLMEEMELLDREGVFIFPGTHSKHIQVENREVTGFKTYMTGEFFDLLSKNSILASSIEDDLPFEHPESRNLFEHGVQLGASSNLLNASFWVRTNELFGKASKSENLHYLSGLLIGTELKELLHHDSAKIFLCCSSNLKSRYEAAISALGIAADKIFPADWVDRSVIRGQIQIYKQFL